MESSEEQPESGPERELERGKESGTGSVPWVTRDTAITVAKAKAKEEKKRSSCRIPVSVQRVVSPREEAKEPKEAASSVVGFTTLRTAPKEMGEAMGTAKPCESFGGGLVGRGMDSTRVAGLGRRSCARSRASLDPVWRHVLSWGCRDCARQSTRLSAMLLGHTLVQTAGNERATGALSPRTDSHQWKNKMMRQRTRRQHLYWRMEMLSIFKLLFQLDPHDPPRRAP